MRLSRLTDTLRQDVRYGIRLLARAPGFTAVAVLTLALGIGATTAIFSLIETILLRAVPIRNASRVVVLEWTARKYLRYESSFGSPAIAENRQMMPHGYTFSYPFFSEVEKSTVFSGVAGFAGAGPLAISGHGEAAIVSGQAVSGSFFQTLGIRAAEGRLLGPADDRPGAAPALVLNYGYWQRAFAGKPCIGTIVELNGVPFTIVGIAESAFTSVSFANVHDVWLPLAMEPLVYPPYASRQNDVHSGWVVIAARLKKGIAATQAQAELDVLFRNHVLHSPPPLLAKDADAPHIELRSAQAALGGAGSQTVHYKDLLRVLMAAVAILLLIACSNVAGLLLSRATSRRREIAVRIALGARPARLLLQLLTESVILAFCGGVAGILLAWWGAHALIVTLTGSAPHEWGTSITIDERVLAVCALASIIAGVLCGIAPALQSLRADVHTGLKQYGAPQSGGPATRWMRLGGALAAFQAALAVVLLMAAGLLVHTLVNLRELNPGFDTRNVITFRVYPDLVGYNKMRIDALDRELEEQIGALPGVLGVSYSNLPPLSGEWMMHAIGRGIGKPSIAADWVPVGPNFFQTMKLPIVAGRALGQSDVEIAAADQVAEDALRKTKPGEPAPRITARALPVVVNQRFVREYSPNTNPLGEEFGSGGAPAAGDRFLHPGYVIVGVARDAKYNDLRRQIQPTMYVPMAGMSPEFEVRTAADPRPFVPAIRNIVRRYDATLPMTDPITQTQLIDRLLRQEQLVAQLSTLFGALALAIVCVGLYGLLSYEVTRRTREIGIRMALGARRAHVVRLVTFEAAGVVVAGVTAGIAAGAGVLRLLKSLLFGVGLADPVTLAGVLALLLVVGAVAAFVPARRASGVDPAIALRQE